MADPPLNSVVLTTALSLALVVAAQAVTTHWTAFMAAPREMAVFVEAVDSSIQENESYDLDVSRVPRLEDKVRLGRLLREIQKGGDELREDLNRLLVSKDSSAPLQTAARVRWAVHRQELAERVRRLDLLRMRFLVVYMGILAASAPPAGGERGKHAGGTTTPPNKEPEKVHARKHAIPKSLSDSITKKPPLRRLATQAMGHSETVQTPHRTGWLGVVQELQRSPIMHKRHASIESAMRSSTSSFRSPGSSSTRSPPLSPLTDSPSPLLGKSRRDLDDDSSEISAPAWDQP